MSDTKGTCRRVSFCHACWAATLPSTTAIEQCKQSCAGNPWELARNVQYPVSFGGTIDGTTDTKAPGMCDAKAAGTTDTKAGGTVDAKAGGTSDAKAGGATGAKAGGTTDAKAGGATDAQAGGTSDAKAGVWTPSWSVQARAYDCPIPGWKTDNCGNLRLWDALPAADLDLTKFNKGEFTDAVEAKRKADAIVSVLYPNDATADGKLLRLQQQYFFVSASMQARTLWPRGCA
jgi:glucan phosphorylase